MSALFKYRDHLNREISIYREDEAVAINTVEPKYGAHSGDPLADNTFHEVFVHESAVEELVAALLSMRDHIRNTPGQ